METLQDLKRFRNTKIVGDLQCGECLLHNHRIVSWDDSFIRISLCGWDTVTTRRRMNQVLDLVSNGMRVYHEKGECFVYGPVRKISIMFLDTLATITIENNASKCSQQ
jgi:hypothetical protein